MGGLDDGDEDYSVVRPHGGMAGAAGSALVDGAGDPSIAATDSSQLRISICNKT